jgi:hypothetical protein
MRQSAAAVCIGFVTFLGLLLAETFLLDILWWQVNGLCLFGRASFQVKDFLGGDSQFGFVLGLRRRDLFQGSSGIVGLLRW